MKVLTNNNTDNTNTDGIMMDNYCIVCWLNL